MFFLLFATFIASAFCACEIRPTLSSDNITLSESCIVIFDPNPGDGYLYIRFLDTANMGSSVTEITTQSDVILSTNPPLPQYVVSREAGASVRMNFTTVSLTPTLSFAYEWIPLNTANCSTYLVTNPTGYLKMWPSINPPVNCSWDLRTMGYVKIRIEFLAFSGDSPVVFTHSDGGFSFNSATWSLINIEGSSAVSFAFASTSNESAFILKYELYSCFPFPTMSPLPFVVTSFAMITLPIPVPPNLIVDSVLLTITGNFPDSEFLNITLQSPDYARTVYYNPACNSSFPTFPESVVFSDNAPGSPNECPITQPMRPFASFSPFMNHDSRKNSPWSVLVTYSNSGSASINGVLLTICGAIQGTSGSLTTAPITSGVGLTTRALTTGLGSATSGVGGTRPTTSGLGSGSITTGSLTSCFQCPNVNRCVAQPLQCMDTCNNTHPFRCHNGNCVSLPSICRNLVTCPSQTEKCWNGKCVLNLFDCDPLPSCPLNTRRCSDGACLPSCSGSLPCVVGRRCPDGTCSVICPPYDGCDLDKPFQCLGDFCSADSSCSNGSRSFTQDIFPFNITLDSSSEIRILKTDGTVVLHNGYIKIDNKVLNVNVSNGAFPSQSQVRVKPTAGSFVRAALNSLSENRRIISQIVNIEFDAIPSIPVSLKFITSSSDSGKSCLAFIDTSDFVWKCITTPMKSVSGNTDKKKADYGILFESSDSDSVGSVSDSGGISDAVIIGVVVAVVVVAVIIGSIIFIFKRREKKLEELDMGLESKRDSKNSLKHSATKKKKSKSEFYSSGHTEEVEMHVTGD